MLKGESSMGNILDEYTARFIRISDGKEFLCRNITPNDCRMYDVELKTFESMSTSKRSQLYKREGGKTYHQPDKKRARVSGAKVRELRRSGHEVVGGQGNWE